MLCYYRTEKADCLVSYDTRNAIDGVGGHTFSYIRILVYLPLLRWPGHGLYHLGERSEARVACGLLPPTTRRSRPRRWSPLQQTTRRLNYLCFLKFSWRCSNNIHRELPRIFPSRTELAPGHFSPDMGDFSYVCLKLKKVVVLKWKQSPFNITYSQLHTSH